MRGDTEGPLPRLYINIQWWIIYVTTFINGAELLKDTLNTKPTKRICIENIKSDWKGYLKYAFALVFLHAGCSVLSAYLDLVHVIECLILHFVQYAQLFSSTQLFANNLRAGIIDW